MPTFAPQIINNSTPAISINVDDSGSPKVTYAQIKQSLGTYVYNVKNLYLYSENLSQLIGLINYNTYDSDGNKTITNISTTFDPYQLVTAMYVDLTKYPIDIIFNGNSSVSTDILPLTSLQIKFMSKRITNSFGGNLTNFLVGEIMAGKPNFFDNYGSPIEDIIETNKDVEKSATVYKNATGDGGLIKYDKQIPRDTSAQIILLSVAAISIGAVFYLNKK